MVIFFNPWQYCGHVLGNHPDISRDDETSTGEIVKMPYRFSPFTKHIAGIFRFLKPVLNKPNVLIALSFVFILFPGFAPPASADKWVGTWSTAPQLVEPGNNPPLPGLSGNTLRQMVHVSIGGDSLQMRFSNEFSSNPVTLNAVHMAVSTGGSAIDTTTDRALMFNGSAVVTMAAGTAVCSDPFEFPLAPLSDVAITICFGETSPDVTGHPGSRTTSYLLEGSQVARGDFSGAVTTDHWYVINTIDVLAPDTAHAVAILGNSITDGRGSGTNKQNRWPDELARRLQANPATEHVAVLNEGIGGNAVLRGGLGPTALSRFHRDVLEQNGVRWLIILEGINDIGGSRGSGVGNELIDAYQQMIYSAHARGILVYGATLLPMKGSSYYSESHETERQTVNNWIRNSGSFDAVIDLDLALRNPADTLAMLPAADTGDHLHPNETGHRMMAEAVDTDLFTRSDSVIFADEGRTVCFEPECASVGESWNILNDAGASNGRYVAVQAGVQSLDTAPRGTGSVIIIPFSVDTAGDYSVFARLNCPTYDDDSFWVKMDDGAFELNNGLVTGGWEWKKFNDYPLSEGAHTLTIGYREDGAGLDKICISGKPYAPAGMGDEAVNVCDPAAAGRSLAEPVGYTVMQNFPNPFNPDTHIRFSIAAPAQVVLKIYDILGQEIAALVNENLNPGAYHSVWDGKRGDGTRVASGMYLYRLSIGKRIISRKMILSK